MGTRKLRWAVVAGLVVLAGVAAFAARPRPNRVTRANYERIREGMTLAEVQAILGPPGDYSSRPSDLYGLGNGGSEEWWKEGEDSGGGPTLWESDEGIISVQFNSRGAIYKGFTLTRDQQRGALDNLRWRAKRQWRRWFPPYDHYSEVADYGG